MSTWSGHDDRQMNGRVGVLIVTHIQEYLEDCIQSVRAQTVPADRVIVVDNASPAGAPASEIAERLGVEYIRLSVPRSLATARNIGCALLDDVVFVASLDGDDLWKPEYLATYSEPLRSGRADVVYGAAELFGAQEGVWFTAADRPRKPDLRRGNFVPANSMFRRDLWWKAGGFDPRLQFFEDWDFWLSCAEAGAAFEAIEQPLWRYRRHARSMLMASKQEERAVARRFIRMKHLPYIWGPLQWRRWRRNFEKYVLRQRREA